MKGKLAVILTTVLCMFTTGCKVARTMSDITQVTYTSDSGTILPELQWHEEFVITGDRVTLIRNGRTENSAVNAGTWEIAVDAEVVTALFTQLGMLDPVKIERVEPEDPPDGGGTEGYTIAYGDGRTLSLLYDPGTTYTGGERIVEPVHAFLRSLALPAEAADRHGATMP